jgi:hypothetical protein
MTPAGSLIALLGVALLLATFAGLVVRRRVGEWYSFALYLLVMAAFSFAFAAYPPAYTHSGWKWQVVVVSVARLAVALELAARTFRAFPGARSTLRAVLLFVMAVMLMAVIAATPYTATYQMFVMDVQPRLGNGTVWIFTAIAALILWYRLPVASLHKSILLAYVPYLLYDTIFLKALVEKSWANDLIGYLNQSIYLLLVSYWARVAWRRPDPPRAEQGGPQAPPGPLERVAAA